MADTFQYPKKRDQFGRHPQFDDTVTKIVGSVMPNPNQKELYQQRDPNKVILDNIPQFSEHRVSCMSYFSNKIFVDRFISELYFNWLSYLGEHRENPYSQQRNEARCRW
jgi:hypothetical protein